MVLKAYYPLNGSVKDVRNGNNGTNNGATAATGILGTQSMDFVASESDYITTGWEPSFVTKTLSAWFNTAYDYSANSTKGVIAETNAREGQIRFEEDNQVYAYVNDGSFVSVTSNTILNDGAWHLATFVIVDNQQIELFIDGKSQGTTSIGSIDTSKASPVTIGFEELNSAKYYDGRIADVRIYDHALTKQEIQYLYSVGERGLHVSDKRNL